VLRSDGREDDRQDEDRHRRDHREETPRDRRRANAKECAKEDGADGSAQGQCNPLNGSSPEEVARRCDGEEDQENSESDADGPEDGEPDQSIPTEDGEPPREDGAPCGEETASDQPERRDLERGTGREDVGGKQAEREEAEAGRDGGGTLRGRMPPGSDRFHGWDRPPVGSDRVYASGVFRWGNGVPNGGDERRRYPEPWAEGSFDGTIAP